jgi:colicin import membrane protein
MEQIVYEHKKGIIGSIIFHILVILYFIIFGFRTPLPLPAEEGILVNFGNTDKGLGDDEQLPASSSALAVAASSQAQQAEEEIMTQNFEEAPVLEKKKITKEEKKPTTATVTKTKESTEQNKEEKTEVKPVEEKRSVDTKALFPGSSESTGQGQGDTEKGGNQGSLNGDPNALAYGTSIGGGGISFSLDGRRPVNLPKPEYSQQKSGIVVVEIIVDKEGKVTSAKAGFKGSTVVDNYLYGVAEKAALAATFDRSASAPAIQKGTITYHFKLQ